MIGPIAAEAADRFALCRDPQVLTGSTDGFSFFLATGSWRSASPQAEAPVRDADLRATLRRLHPPPARPCDWPGRLQHWRQGAGPVPRRERDQVPGSCNR